MKKSGNKNRKQNLDRDTPEMKWDHKMFEYRYGMEPSKPRESNHKKSNYGGGTKKTNIYYQKKSTIKENEEIFEDKISNVSTSYSSKEKTLEEENLAPILMKMNSAEEDKVLFDIRLTYQNKKVELVITKEEEIEEKLNNLFYISECFSLSLRIKIVREIISKKIFSNFKLESYIDELVSNYMIERAKGSLETLLI